MLTEGGKVTELSISPVDMQLIESRRYEKEDICQALGVPPIIIGDSDKASSWGTGIDRAGTFCEALLLPQVGCPLLLPLPLTLLLLVLAGLHLLALASASTRQQSFGAVVLLMLPKVVGPPSCCCCNRRCRCRCSGWEQPTWTAVLHAAHAVQVHTLLCVPDTAKDPR